MNHTHDEPPLDEVKAGFGLRLRAVLDAEGVDVQAFAATLETSLSSIYRWLDGRTVPRVLNLLAICSHYPDWDLRYLLTGEGEMRTGAAKPPPASAYPRYQDTRNLIGAFYGFKSEADRLKIPYYPPFVKEIKAYLKTVIAENERLLQQVKDHLSPS